MGTDLRGTLLFRKTLGCLMAGLIGDAIGTDTEGMEYMRIERQFGWIDDFESDGTDDTIMKDLLAEALIETDGFARLDDWARVWVRHRDVFVGEKRGKFFVGVPHVMTKMADLGVTPRMAALGTPRSTSSGMCISPVGIVNACNPEQAARQAYNIASLIHMHEAGVVHDGAASMAAAVAEAMKPDATVDSVVQASLDAILPVSGRETLDRMRAMLEVARATGEFHRFRDEIYRQRAVFFHPTTDGHSTEIIPLCIGLFLLAGGDTEKTIVYAANFGRNTDTIASVAGAIAGALQGVDGIRQDWVDKVRRVAAVDQDEQAEQLAACALRRLDREEQAGQALSEVLA